jgi:heme/copper-type cytochrome/quinol oxidase subunit 2
MTALVNVVSPAQYQAWLTEQRRMITQANDQVSTLRQYLQRTGQL